MKGVLCPDCGTTEFRYVDKANDRARLDCPRGHEFPTAEPMTEAGRRADAALRERAARGATYPGGEPASVRYAADDPIGWYRSFLLDTVIPNSHVFAHLTALGEVAVGLSLTLGVVTVLGAFFGFFQVLFYALAVQHMSSGQQGFHVMLGAMMIAFFFARAGRCWGIDSLLVRRYPRSFWTAVG